MSDDWPPKDFDIQTSPQMRAYLERTYPESAPQDRADKLVQEAKERRAFPWVEHLPEDERVEFFRELYTALSNIHHGVPNPTSAHYLGAVEEVVIPWRSTAEVHADPELYAILTADHEPADFSEVEPPYMPKYAVHSIVVSEDRSRYRVQSVEEANGHYVLRPLFSSAVRADLVLWAWRDCDEHSTLEWVDDKPVYAIKAHGQHLRSATTDELKDLGVKTDG